VPVPEAAAVEILRAVAVPVPAAEATEAASEEPMPVAVPVPDAEPGEAASEAPMPVAVPVPAAAPSAFEIVAPEGKPMTSGAGSKVGAWAALPMVPVIVRAAPEITQTSVPTPINGQYRTRLFGRTVSGENPFESCSISAAVRATSQIPISAISPLSGEKAVGEMKIQPISMWPLGDDGVLLVVLMVPPAPLMKAWRDVELVNTAPQCIQEPAVPPDADTASAVVVLLHSARTTLSPRPFAFAPSKITPK
jgi:hypothetical protein